MAEFRVAQRYAKGLMLFANETHQAEVIYAEMKDISNTINQSDDLKRFLKSPIIEANKKEIVLKEIFKSFSKITNTFISLVVKQGRENILSKIAEQFIANYNLANNIVTAEIISAVQLDKQTIDNIIAKAKQTFAVGNQINIINKIDTSLIGGFILKVGNNQIDSSIKTKLATLKKDFSK